MLKTFIVLKFNNVEKLKSMWKMLKDTRLQRASGAKSQKDSFGILLTFARRHDILSLAELYQYYLHKNF
nr:hypothetical protein DXGOKGYL_DXGOKGYL_CDS_0005 [Microvirus sp.]